MQRVSDLYRREQQQAFAGPVLCKITFGLVDSDAAATATVSATAGLPFSTPQTAVYEEGAPQRVYATLEPGRMKLDGRQLIPPAEKTKQHSEGFVSQQMSDSAGSFTTAPRVTIAFTKTHTVPALTFTFDRATGEWCSLRLRAWRGKEQLLDTEVQPDKADYTLEQPIERFDKLELTFLGTSQPHRRARLQQLMFGVGMLFDNRLIRSAAQRLEVDPITRRLPQNSFKFELVNTNLITGDSSHLYDPDNPTGVWKYMEQHSPIKVEYGQTITQSSRWGDLAGQTWGDVELTDWGSLYSGGYVEWLPGGRYYLDAAPSVNGLTAKFSSYDLFGLMTGSYSKGVYDGQPHSLFDLATAVLTDARLPQIQADRQPWELWEGLRQIASTAPLPAKSHRDLLQLIAHAACCVLYVDREGVLRIQPLPTEQHSLTLDFDSMLGEPKASKIPTLYRVDCLLYSYLTKETAKELHNGEYWVVGTVTVPIRFGMAAVVDNVTVAGAAVISQSVYAHGVELVLQGNGAASVKVTGRGLISSSAAVSSVVPKADENGAVETVDNPLITSVNTAAAVANWVRDYLGYRTTYEFASRGNPECDPLDIIRLDSAFDKSFPAVVLKNETSFDGGMKGKMICKRRVTGET